MDRVSERDRSTRKSRDDRERESEKDRERSESHRDHHRDGDRDRDRKHRHHHNDKHGDDRMQRSKDDRRHRSRADSPQDLEPRRERSSDRVRDSVEREQSVEKRHPYSSRKRKDHGGDDEEDLDKNGKRVRVSEGGREEKRERRRFGDRALEEESDLNGVYKEEKKVERSSKGREKEEERKERKVKDEETSDGEGHRKRKRESRRFSDDVDGGKEVDRKEVKQERKFKDRVKMEKEELDEVTVGRKEMRGESRFKERVKEECLGSPEEEMLKGKPIGEWLVNGDRRYGALEKGGSAANDVAQEPLAVASEVSMISAASTHLRSSKVSSIITTNENEGVSIIRSDEVPGKSSTDGSSTSVVGKSGNLSLDALAKAKKALQMQKELSEKLKKIPMLNKLASTSSDKNLQVASNKDGQKVPLSSAGSQHGPSISTTSAATPVPALPSTAKAPVGAAASVSGMGVPGLPTIPNIEAVKRAQELAAKMGYRQDPEFAPLINMFPGPSAVPEMAVPQRPSKAPVLRLDAQGREIDEYGNVINMPKLTNLSTLKVNINKQKKEAFQILRPDLDADTQSNPHFDGRMGINKTKLLRPKRMSFQFVEEGRWSKQAEIIKIKNQFGEAQSKELKVKQSQLAKAKAEPDDNPNLIAIGERVFKEKKKDEIPEIEWWDKLLIHSGTYSSDTEEKLNMDRITIYVEHPRPIEPPAEPAPPPPQPLKLTKKEQKKLRTQRRLAKERDRQEMIRQGLLEPPKAKVKMSNLMKVLGSEATQDPTRLEMEIRSAAAEREQAHVDRNIARKLTPAERREKKEKKLFEDPTTLETLVSVYKINDLSHPQTRFKVDVNAQENRLTGTAVISDGISVVVVEGGKKSIKRYGKLMLKRINWAAAVGNEEDGDENPDAPINRCVLVWQGSVAKPSFNRFLVHQCRSEAAGRKVFADAGVPHYWDLAINFSDEIL